MSFNHELNKRECVVYAGDDIKQILTKKDLAS